MQTLCKVSETFSEVTPSKVSGKVYLSKTADWQSKARVLNKFYDQRMFQKLYLFINFTTIHKID
jgi:hypothetical protein